MADKTPKTPAELTARRAQLRAEWHKRAEAVRTEQRRKAGRLK